MRTFLNAICWFCAIACSWLGVMYLILQRPGFEWRLGVAILFVLQSLLALAVLNGLLSRRPWRLVAGGGAAGIVWAGGAAIADTLRGPHFEGFALIIGAFLVLQGLLTIWLLVPKPFTPSSKVHQFGM